MAKGRRTRVLHVIQNLNYGGMERLVADIVRGVDPKRVESHVLVLEYVGRFGTEIEGHARVHEARPMEWYSMLWPGRLAQLIQSIAPDVVHSHSGVWYKASLAARLAGVPGVLHTDHGRPADQPRITRFLDGLGATRTTAVVAVSDTLAHLLERKVVRGRCPVHVVLNGVNTELFRPGAATPTVKAQLELADDTPVLGSIGRLEPVKGYGTMIEGFAQLLAHSTFHPQPVLVIAGDGSARPDLELLIARLGLTGKVHLLGWRNDVHELLASFDLFTMSSRSEGTSVSLLEAMSTGLCPVVTDVGGNRAVLGPELEPRLVSSNDADALATAWANALDDPERMGRDGNTARARVQAEYSAATMIAAYERLYEVFSPMKPESSVRRR